MRHKRKEEFVCERDAFLIITNNLSNFTILMAVPYFTVGHGQLNSKEEVKQFPCTFNTFPYVQLVDNNFRFYSSLKHFPNPFNFPMATAINLFRSFKYPLMICRLLIRVLLLLQIIFLNVMIYHRHYDALRKSLKRVPPRV